MIELDKKEKAINKAKELLHQLKDPMHSIAHMAAVLNYGKEILLSYPEVDQDLLEIATWWHDVGRIHMDQDHASRSAEMARFGLQKVGIPKVDIEKICLAIEGHSNRSEMKPTTIEGVILKDADKLDFLSVDRWQTGIKYQRSYEIEVGVRKIPEIGHSILVLPESKVIYKRLLNELVEYIRHENNPFLEQYKPEIIEGWKVDL